MNFSNIWNHPKTSIAGVLICVVTIAGVLSQQGITLGNAGTGTVIALVGALATALLGLLSKDPGSTTSVSSGAVKTGVFILFACAGLALSLCGCPSTTAVHKASVAAASIGSSLQSAATVNHQLIEAAVESPEEGATMASYIDQAAKANDAFVKVIQSLPDNGSQITAQQALAAFNTLEQQITTLNQQGVLHLKSAQAQQAFAAIMTSIQGSIAAIEVVIAATSSRGPPLHGPGIPAALPLMALVLTPEEIDELISLALAAGSALVTKLMSLKGETDPQLQSAAQAADAAAEQQAEADEQPQSAQ